MLSELSRKAAPCVKLGFLTLLGSDEYDSLIAWNHAGLDSILMHTTVRYGRNSEIQLDLASTEVLFYRDAPPGKPLDDVAAATVDALREPLEFPPLRRAVTPDDHVAIAVAAGVPQASAVVAGVVQALCESGIDPLHVIVVQAAADEQVDIAAGLTEELRTSVRTMVHRGDNREQLGYLAVGEDEHPIYFNRELCDADVVIPVGCLRADGGLGFTGVDAGLYPTFADEAAQRRFNAPSAAGDQIHRHCQREAEAANWQLGVMLTVQVLPGGGDAVLKVVAGERHAVERHGRAICREIWSFAAPQRASLVVATIEGSSDQQTWENFARALNAASHAVADDGAIAVCTELAAMPGMALQRLSGDVGGDAAIRKIRRDTSPDALAAAELWRVLADHRVYLLSRLDADVVESLGMAYVADGEEIARLCSRHDSCIVLGNAPFAVPKPE